MEHVIWDSEINLEDWENYDDLPENEFYDRCWEDNQCYLADEKLNLQIPVDGVMIAIADVGRWDGRKHGYKFVPGNCIADCLDWDYDDIRYYVDEQGDLRCVGKHHDGCDYLLFRELKPELEDEEFDKLEDNIWHGLTGAELDKYTRKLGDRIAKVYGWDM